VSSGFVLYLVAHLSARLGTFLDLKMENQRSQQRLQWLKASESATATSSAPPPHPITFNPSRQLSDITSYYSTPAGQSWGVWGDFVSSPTQSTFDDGASHHPYSSDVYSQAGINTSTADDDTSEDGSKRKKVAIRLLLGFSFSYRLTYTYSKGKKATDVGATRMHHMRSYGVP
jgi:hypothetical protein